MLLNQKQGAVQMAILRGACKASQRSLKLFIETFPKILKKEKPVIMIVVTITIIIAAITKYCHCYFMEEECYGQMQHARLR